jgi:hypothetical protein
MAEAARLSSVLVIHVIFPGASVVFRGDLAMSRRSDPKTFDDSSLLEDCEIMPPLAQSDRSVRMRQVFPARGTP